MIFFNLEYKMDKMIENIYLPDEPFISIARRFDPLITPRTNRPSNGTYIKEINNWPRFC